MLLVVFTLLSVIVALLRGGKLTHLNQVSFRLPWLILLGFWIQILIFTPLLGPHLTHEQTVVAYNLSMILIWGTLLLNRHLPGAPLMALGVFLNWLVITLNGGFMPASETALARAGLLEVVTLAEGQRHNNSILIHEGTRLPWLADVMAVPASFPLANVFSVGDVLLALGAAWFFQRTMLPGQPEALPQPAPRQSA